MQPFHVIPMAALVSAAVLDSSGVGYPAGRLSWRSLVRRLGSHLRPGLWSGACRLRTASQAVAARPVAAARLGSRLRSGTRGLRRRVSPQAVVGAPQRPAAEAEVSCAQAADGQAVVAEPGAQAERVPRGVGRAHWLGSGWLVGERAGWALPVRPVGHLCCWAAPVRSAVPRYGRARPSRLRMRNGCGAKWRRVRPGSRRWARE